MTVKDCYDKLHGNYEDVQERFLEDKRIKKFLFLFLNDEHFDKLGESMKNQDWNEAFLNAHTLKGVCANLSLSYLLDEVKILTELLRGGNGSDEANESYERVKDAYVLTRDAIEELKNNE